MHLAAFATPVAFVFQLIGGIVTTWTAAQVVAQTSTGVQLDPVLAASWAAIGAMFSLLVWFIKDRFQRADKREDESLGVQKEQTSTLRELGAAVSKAADVTASAVTAANGANEASRINSSKHDAALGKIDALSVAITNNAAQLAELRRAVEIMADERRK